MAALTGKRVLFVLPSLELGGSERQALLFARWLRESHGAEVSVWGKGPPGRASALCDEAKLPWRAVEMDLRVGRMRLWWNLRRFAREVCAARAEVLLPYTTGPNVFCGATWRRAGASACVWNQRDEGRRLGVRPIDARAARNTPVLVSNSAHAADVLRKALGVTDVRVIHNGVELAAAQKDRATWRRELGVDDDALLCVMVANVHGYKDHATLLRAWRKVADELRERAVLCLAGKPGDRQAECERVISDLVLGNHVRSPGQVADIPGLLAAADLGVFSSHKEGCPNGVLECMAAGLPVIGTDIPGVREALGQGDVYAPENDADALAAQLLRVMGDASLRGALGDANKARIAAEFSPQKMCEATAQAILDATTRP